MHADLFCMVFNIIHIALRVYQNLFFSKFTVQNLDLSLFICENGAFERVIMLVSECVISVSDDLWLAAHTINSLLDCSVAPPKVSMATCSAWRFCTTRRTALWSRWPTGTSHSWVRRARVLPWEREEAAVGGVGEHTCAFPLSSHCLMGRGSGSKNAVTTVHKNHGIYIITLLSWLSPVTEASCWCGLGSR